MSFGWPKKINKTKHTERNRSKFVHLPLLLSKASKKWRKQISSLCQMKKKSKIFQTLLKVEDEFERTHHARPRRGPLQCRMIMGTYTSRQRPTTAVLVVKAADNDGKRVKHCQTNIGGWRWRGACRSISSTRRVSGCSVLRKSWSGDHVFVLWENLNRSFGGNVWAKIPGATWQF